MTLAYHPLPEPAFAAAHATVVRLGYDKDAFLRDYRFLDAEGATVRTNGLAFADPIRRTPSEFAAITVHALGPEAGDGGEWARAVVEVLSRSGAPFHLTHRGEVFDLWTVAGAGPTATPRRVDQGIAPTRLAEALGRFGGDLAPARVADVKQGRARFTHPAFADVQPIQFSLFVEDVNGPVLRRYFAGAVDVLREAQARTGAWDEDTTTDLAVRLLGALVLADTGALDEDTRVSRRDLSVATLFARAAGHYPHYFPATPDAVGDALAAAYGLLGDLSYAVFEPGMLVELYRAAYTQDQRKRLGRFDTPIHLTRRILEHVPVELLRPEDRHVCDMTAGWGSFLIAAHDRLARLGDMTGRPLSAHLHGNDIDRSASQLARFGLLLSTLTDSWQVDTADALDWAWLDAHRPTVIVGNPPFGGSRKRPGEGVVRRAQEQAANKFVRRAVERLAPGGLLAMIVPRSFFASESASEARQALLGACDVQELWDLPQAIFKPDATAETSVVFARRHHAGGRATARGTARPQVGVGGRAGAPAPATAPAAAAAAEVTVEAPPVVARTVQRGTLAAFVRDGSFTRTQLQPTQSAWGTASRRGKSATALTTHMMHVRLVLSAREWRALADRCVPLSARATVFPGCVRGNAAQRRRPVHDASSERVPWLTRAQRVVPRRFAVDYDAATTVLYPAQVEEPRWKHRRELARPKVLVASVNNPSWGQRVTVAVERRGYYVSDSFWAVAPTPEGERANYTLEVLAAVTGWLVGNAWVLEHLRSPKLPGQALRAIPVPPAFSDAEREELADAVRALEDAAARQAPEPREALAVIDRVLRAKYALDDATYGRLRAAADPAGTGGAYADPPRNPHATWKLSGRVTAVDAARGTVTLALPGFDGPQELPIGPNMPGWLLRPGTPFQTTVTPEVRADGRATAASDFGTFAVGPYPYLDEGQVLEALADVVHGARARAVAAG